MKWGDVKIKELLFKIPSVENLFKKYSGKDQHLLAHGGEKKTWLFKFCSPSCEVDGFGLLLTGQSS